MGHSINSFRDGRLDANDGVIVVWVRLILKEIDALPAKPEWLGNLRDEWTEQAELELSGCLNLGLDEWLTGPEKIEILRDLSVKALERLRGEGDICPKEYLNELTEATPESYYTKDVETALFTRYGETFIELLDGKITGYFAHR